MGGSSSSAANAKYTSNIVNQSDLNALSENINTFTASTIMEAASKQSASIVQLQSVDLSNMNVGGDLNIGNISQEQNANLSFDSLNTTTFQNELANGILNQLTAAVQNSYSTNALAALTTSAEASGKSNFLNTGGGNANTSSNTDYSFNQTNVTNQNITNVLKNSINNNLSMKTINDCISKIKSAQTVILAGSKITGSVNIGAITQQQASSLLSKCVNTSNMGGSIVSQAAQDLGLQTQGTASTTTSTTLASTAKAEASATGPLEGIASVVGSVFGGIASIFTSIFSSAGGIISSVVICIVIMIVAGFLLMRSGAMNGGGQNILDGGTLNALTITDSSDMSFGLINQVSRLSSSLSFNYS